MKGQNLSKRPARVFAMELLYAMEMTGEPVGQCVDGVLDSVEKLYGKDKKNGNEKSLIPEMKRYGMSLVDQIQERRVEFDKILSEYSRGWELDRFAVLDRIILYIALAELLYETDVPVKVVIQESIEMANKYSTENSYRFINGILNQFARDKGIIFASDKSEEKR